MKTIAQFIDLNGISSHMERLRHELDWLLEARDAEHRAELAAAQATIEQLGKDDAAIAEKLDRAVELLRGIRMGCDVAAWRTIEAALAVLTAPPPAESTPLPSCAVSCTKCSYRAVGLTLDEAVLIDGEHKATHTISPPDDIRERLDDVECTLKAMHAFGNATTEAMQSVVKRVASLEAKGEPGTPEVCIAFRGYGANPLLCKACGKPAGPPHHPKGAKP